MANLKKPSSVVENTLLWQLGNFINVKNAEARMEAKTAQPGQPVSPYAEYEKVVSKRLAALPPHVGGKKELTEEEKLQQKLGQAATPRSTPKLKPPGMS